MQFLVTKRACFIFVPVYDQFSDAGCRRRLLALVWSSDSGTRVAVAVVISAGRDVGGAVGNHATVIGELSSVWQDSDWWTTTMRLH